MSVDSEYAEGKRKAWHLRCGVLSGERGVAIARWRAGAEAFDGGAEGRIYCA